ncbi:MAG: histidine kinase, partial [Gemmatimonadota bacterium]
MSAESGWRDLVVQTRQGKPLLSAWANVRLSDGSQIGIGIDVRKHREAERQLRELNAALEQRARQLQAMTLELTQAEQRERHRLAQLLHDHLQQLLVGAKFRVGMLRSRADDEQEVRDGAREVDHLLDESIQASRSLTYELSPPVLYEQGLPACLEWLARQMADAAKKAIAGIEFVPGAVDGSPVATRVIFPIEFVAR